MTEHHPTTDTASGTDTRWFVLRFLYRDQPAVRARFREERIETFSPMRPVVRVRNGRKITVQEPVIWDLLFVRSTREVLDPIVASYDNFQYRYKTGGGYCEPLVVPDRQMNDFVRAVEASEHPLYFTPQELNLEKGVRVRLLGGVMDGYEGRLLKVKGGRARRLLVEIPNTLIAAVEVAPDLIQLLD